MKSRTIKKIAAYLRARGALEEAIQLEQEMAEMERDMAELAESLSDLIRADKSNWSARRDAALNTLVKVGLLCA